MEPVKQMGWYKNKRFIKASMVAAGIMVAMLIWGTRMLQVHTLVHTPSFEIKSIHNK
ncbi:MAG: hypothetical protein U0289_04830 [Cyclobacteriaceae bacterium]|nr:hypothetical protein [Cyclobacteriaceae bacterium]